MNLLVSALVAFVHFTFILAAQTITVIVAPQGKLEYDPPYVRMGPGDTVLFIFQDAKHSVTQSRPNTPCVKLPEGSFTPIAPSTLGTREEHSFTLYNHYDGEPRYFFSETHCQDGMVFAINPPSGALDAYRAAARNTGSNSPPPPSTPPPQAQPQPNPPSITTVTVGGSVTTVVTVPSSDPQRPPNQDSPNSNANPASPAPAPSGASSVATSSPSGSLASVNPSETGSPQPPRPGAPGVPYEHIIGVGDDGLLAFSPARIQALVGDVVTFEVRSENHSIVQSSFEAPCQPLVREDGNLGFRSGLLSGGKQAAGDFVKYSKFSIKVNDTTPSTLLMGRPSIANLGWCSRSMSNRKISPHSKKVRAWVQVERALTAVVYAPWGRQLSHLLLLFRRSLCCKQLSDSFPSHCRFFSYALSSCHSFI